MNMQLLAAKFRKKGKCFNCPTTTNSAMRKLFLGDLSQKNNDTLKSVLGFFWNTTEMQDDGLQISRERKYSHIEMEFPENDPVSVCQ